MTEERGLPPDELLYRRVPDRPGSLYKAIDGGGYRVTSVAFNDKSGRPPEEQQPSVNRAALHENDPTKSRKRDTDLVVSFTVAGVQSISGCGVLKVIPDPNPLEDPDNEAHALIVAKPPFPCKKQFEKFKQMMARVADSRWEIAPGEDR